MTLLQATLYTTAFLVLAAFSSWTNAGYSDGPYVFYKADPNQFEAHWMCEDKAVIKQISVISGEPFEACDLQGQLHDVSFTESLIEYEGQFDIAAFSDMHGQFDLSRKLLINNGIIDEHDNWAFGNGHLVITGDVFDRGDKVTEILWLLYKLDKQSQLVGGQLHLLLGNHEVMVLNGDLRYLHPKYVKTAQVLNRPFESLFDQTAVLGQWLRSKAVLAKVNGYLFAHGGFHPHLAKEGHSLQDINRVFKRSLVESELPDKRVGFAKYLHKSNGPIWYRGYFKDEGASAAELELLLKHFSAKKIIVGHTSQSQVTSRYNGQVIAIDTSIKRGQYGELLLIKKDEHNVDRFYRGKLDGSLEKLTFAAQ